MSDDMLFAQDIARRRKISRSQARRWLEMLEAEYGASVVGRVRGRRGVRRYTTEAALARIGPRAANVETKLMSAIGDLVRRIDALEEKIGGRPPQKCV